MHPVISSTKAHAKVEPPILATKLFAPPFRQGGVRRDRLVARLEAASGLVLVSAAAGFGKSTLLAEWLSRQDATAAWLSLEPADNDRRRFLTYLAAALGNLRSDLGATLAPWLKAPQLPPAEAIINPLVNALSLRREPLCLILDDYHTIDSQDIHDLVQHLMEHLPANVVTVLSTRADPPFSLSRWRGQGRLTELRDDDLRFSSAESHAFLSEVMGLDLPDRLVEALLQRTEGWVVGLQMAALSMRSQSDLASFVDAFTGSHRFVLEYLTDEVLTSQTEGVLAFLLRISVLERFSGQLCDAVLQRHGSRDLLAQLEAENLFLICLDDNREWYRFHHLFGQMLERQAMERLPPEVLRELRLRACDWLIDQGLAEEALTQALAASHRERCLEVLERFAGPALQQGDATTVMGWFDRVPAAWLEAQPRLALTRALALFLAVRWNELEGGAAQLQELLSEELDEATAGRALAFAACTATVRDNRRTVIETGRRALDLLPPEDNLFRAVAAVVLGVALLRSSDYPAAHAAFGHAASHSGSEDHFGLAATCAYYNGKIELITGNSFESSERHRRAWEPEANTPLPHPMSSLGLVGQAEAAYEWGQLDRARALAQQAIDVNRGCFPFNEIQAQVLLVNIARASRNFPEALLAAQHITGLMQKAVFEQWESQIRIHRLRTLALSARLQQDRRAKAEWQQWIDDIAPEMTGDLTAVLFPDEPQTAAISLYIRWLLWRRQEDLALELAVRMRSLAEARQWHRAVIESWLLEALAHDQGSRTAPLQVALLEALELAEPGRFVQVLADEGEWLRSLPAGLRLKVAAGLTKTFRALVAPTLGIEDCQDTPPSAFDLPEMLSDRELEVLHEVATGGTNAAVGRSLFISPQTVKKHLENIYGKLAVHNRVEAIHRAREMGLLREMTPQH